MGGVSREIESQSSPLNIFCCGVGGGGAVTNYALGGDFDTNSLPGVGNLKYQPCYCKIN